MIMVISPEINLKVGDEEVKSATIRIEKIRCHSKRFFATDKRSTRHPGGKSRDFQPT